MADTPDKFAPVENEPNPHGIGGLSLRSAFSGKRCKLALEGELKHGNSDELYQEVLRLFQSGVTDLILDFRNLSYCDTAGLQSMVRIYKYTQEYPSYKFVILVQESELYDILRTCRFDKFMEISVDDAIAQGDWTQG